MCVCVLCLYVRVCVCIFVYVCMYLCMYVHMCVCILCTYVCMYICILQTYTHAYVHTTSSYTLKCLMALVQRCNTGVISRQYQAFCVTDNLIPPSLCVMSTIITGFRVVCVCPCTMSRCAIALSSPSCIGEVIYQVVKT